MSPSIRSERQVHFGHGLIRFSGVILMISSIVKFLHPDKAVAYMRFLGYEHEKLFLIAGVELVLAILYLVRSTRAVGLLLVSSYLGGAIAAHLADHPLIGNAPIVVFNASHHYLGAVPAVILLLCAWAGVWLSHPESLWSVSPTQETSLRAARSGRGIPIAARSQQ
jgi:hypothetical protein